MRDDGMHTWDDIHRMLDEAVAYIRSQTDFKPEIGIILGTGLGSLVDGILSATGEYGSHVDTPPGPARNQGCGDRYASATIWIQLSASSSEGG